VWVEKKKNPLFLKKQTNTFKGLMAQGKKKKNKFFFF